MSTGIKDNKSAKKHHLKENACIQAFQKVEMECLLLYGDPVYGIICIHYRLTIQLSLQER